MRARGDLRHDAAERGVLVDLRQHDVGQNPAGAGLRSLDHGRRSFVAGRLDAEYNHQGSIRPYESLPEAAFRPARAMPKIVRACSGRIRPSTAGS